MKTKNLKVTAEIKKLFNDGGKVKAAVSLTVESVFVIQSVYLVEGNKGLFVSMPNRKSAAGKFYDICFPVNNETRLHILATVTDAYEKALKTQTENAADSGQETA